MSKTYRRVAFGNLVSLIGGIGVIVLATATVTARPGVSQQADASRGSIWGTVVSSRTGQPVDRVRLRLSGAGLPGARTTYSDDDGKFAFIDLPAGAFTLRASKDGYVGLSYGQLRPRAGRAGTPIQLAAGQHLTDLKFELPPGGAMTGSVFDQKSRPSVGTRVRVLQQSMTGGEPSLEAVGSGTTDDRGMYRVWGLAPGDYVVSAVPGNAAARQASAMAEDRAADGGDDTEDTPVVGYAPVYHPGLLDIAQAWTVSLAVSEERTGVDVFLQQVPMARVEGQVMAPPDVLLSDTTVTLYSAADEVPGVRPLSVEVDNEDFSFPAVPPGTYRAVATANLKTARSEDGGQMWAATDLSISGGRVADLALVLRPGLTVSGQIEFKGGALGRPGRVRVTLAPYSGTAIGAGVRSAPVDEHGAFVIADVVPGAYDVRASGARGWHLTSATLGSIGPIDAPDAIDTLDTGLDLSGGHDVTDLVLRFSDQTTRISGTLQDALGLPTSDYTVVVFSADTRYWEPWSRRIQAARLTTTGHFTFTGLPAGRYRLAALFDVEPGMWFDPAFLEQLAPTSVAVQLFRGQEATQSLRVSR